MSSTEIINMVKTQMLSLQLLQKDTTGILPMLFTFFLMSFFEKLSNSLPGLFDFFKNIFINYIKKRTLKIVNKNKYIHSQEEKLSSIIIEKHYINNNTNSELPDAILDYISNINNVKYVKYRNIFIINNNEEIDIPYGEYNFKIKLINTVYDKEGEIDLLILEIFSYTYTLKELRDILDLIKNDYIIKKTNKLGEQSYYFNEIVQSLKIGPDRELNYSGAPKYLKFSMTAFHSNKTLDNIYGKYVNIIKEQFRFFINNKDWYASKGIPYTFGLLLSGDPGVGKTSIIKAIANETKYHIINISLHNSITKSQLNNLFYQDKIAVDKDGIVENYIIPLNKRIYVIEDIDCLSDIVLDRQYKKNKDDDKQPFKIVKTPQNHISDFYLKDDSEKLTLSYILNILDGILEIPNRILIITSNYPERLDKALVRCGRIDFKVKFPKCDKMMILEMINNFYDITLDIKDLKDVKENVYTPASINQILFINKDSYKKAIEELKNILIEDADIKNQNKDEKENQNKDEKENQNKDIKLIENNEDDFKDNSTDYFLKGVKLIENNDDNFGEEETIEEKLLPNSWGNPKNSSKHNPYSKYSE